MSGTLFLLIILELVEEVLVSVSKVLVDSNFSFTVHNLHELLSLLLSVVLSVIDRERRGGLPPKLMPPCISVMWGSRRLFGTQTQAA